MSHTTKVYELTDDVFKRYLELFLEDAERREIDTKSRRWIPVSEMLPEGGQEVLIVFDNRVFLTTYEAHTAMLDDGDNSVNVRGFRQDCNDFLFAEGRDFPTHWMPCPEPPEEEVK